MKIQKTNYFFFLGGGGLVGWDQGGCERRIGGGGLRGVRGEWSG